MDRQHSTPTRARRPLLGLLGLLAVGALVLGACSSGDEDGDADQSGTPSTEDERMSAPRLGPPDAGSLPLPAIEGPVTGGEGAPVLGPPGFDLAGVGYTEEEFFLSGDATSYTSAEPLGEDGEWDVEPDSSAPYTTRVLVRRPTDPAAFDGTVVLEWLNVSGGLDASPDWSYTHNEIIRRGSVWVGVSAQQAGIVGGGNPLGAALALKNADPVRYEALDHPGDDHSYDIFSQAGTAAWFAPDELLGGLEPDMVIAMGESQSAFRLTTYLNAVAPLTDVFDGYLVHSRASSGAPLSEELEAPDPTYSRTDLEVPVLVLSAETDLAGDRLGYARARQDDTDWFAGWEVAGTAHADSYNLGIADTDDGSGKGDDELFASMSDPPSSVYFDVISCDLPINTGPHTYVARAALATVADWARTGEAPAGQPRLELDDTGDAFVVDEDGNAVGGIRTPQLDAPIATLSGLGQAGDSFCALFGTTAPLSTDRLGELYPDHDTFVDRWNESLDAAVDAGVVLDADAQQLRRVAEQSSIGGGAAGG